MAKQSINIGSAANDGTGDPLRTAFDKINDNFNEIYSQLGGGHQSSGQTTLANIAFSGNTIQNIVTNADISIEPNGTGKVIISSDLEVKGTTTQLNATTIQIEDNLLELNRNSSGADVDAGIFVNRGTALNSAFFYWNEGEDKWKAVLSTSDDSVTSAVTDTSTATIVANFEGDTLSINSISSTDSSAVQINDTVNISGSLSVNTIDVNTLSSGDSSAIQIEEDLNVSGNISANRIDVRSIESNDSTALTIEDALRVIGTLSADTAEINNLSSGDSTAIQIQDAVNISGSLSVDNIDTNFLDSNDSGAIQILKTINVGGDVNATGNLRVDGELRANNVINGGSTTGGVREYVVDSATVIELNETVHVLAANEQDFTMAAGSEGQIIHFVLGGGDSTANAGANTTVTITNVRDPRDQDVLSTYAWKPFINPGASETGDSTIATRTLATCVYAAGAWNLDNFIRL